MGLATAAATIMLITYLAVGSAASQATYTSALASVVSSETSFLQTGLAKFAKITPTGGYQNCGVDLYTQVTTYGTSTPVLVGPNSPVPPPIDATNQLYEYAANGQFEIAPLIGMSGIPLVNQIPGLGQPVQMHFSAVKMVEHPQGLSFNANSNGGTYSGQLPLYSRTPIVTSGSSNQTSNSPIWRTPDIFHQIANQGQTVVSTTVFVVHQDTTLVGLPWQSSGITVLPGQNVWMDSNAIGEWQMCGNQFDANGLPPATYDSVLPACYYDHRFNGNGLIGYLGTPPFFWDGHPAANQNDPNEFFVGNTLTNYHLPSSGVLNFMANTCMHYPGGQNQSSGDQLVRIIITQ